MPILGDNTQGGSTNPGSDNRALLTRFTAAEDGTLNRGYAYFGAASSAGSSAKVLLYSDTGTAPGTLIAASPGASVPAGGGLVDCGAMSGSIVNGTSYWIGVVYSDFQANVSVDDSLTGMATHMANGSLSYASPPASWPGSDITYTNIRVNAYVDYTAGAAPTLDQEGFRFGADDGSESAHTWIDAQDADVTQPLAQNLLLRALVNSTGDPASAGFKLKYQKNGAGGYVDVPVGASAADVYGTVTFGAWGTSASGGTSVAPTYPAGITAGQYLTLHVSSGGTGDPTPSTPSGWTLLATGASTDGTFGIDTGPRRMTVFGKEATGSETGTVTVSITNGNTCRGSIARWTKSGSGSWDVSAQGAGDSTSGTGVSIAFASVNWNTGDAALVAVSQRVDSATQSAQSLTATGVTFGTRTNRESTAVTTGNDHRHVVDTFAAVSATSSVDAAPTWAYTASAAVSAGGVIVRLREFTAGSANEVYVAPSSNIAAGGEATTARLTAPSGKTTADFVTGRRWDDENGADSINITVDDYTELEWCLQAQSPAANGDYFDFRVYSADTAFDTYTVTPRWTIGTAAQSASITEAASASDSPSASVTRAADVTEAASGSESSAATGGGQTGAVTEAASAADVQAAANATSAASTEAASAADAYSYPAGAVLPNIIAAIGTGGAANCTTGAIDTTGATQIAVVVVTQSATAPTVSDSKSNTWAQDGTPLQLSSAFSGYVSVWRCTSATPSVGTGHTFTANGTSATSVWAISIGPSAGGTVTLSAWSKNADASSPYAHSGVTTTIDPSLIIAFGADDGSGNPVTLTWANSFAGIAGSAITDQNSFWGGSLASRSVTTAGTYTPQFTTSSSAPSNAVLAALIATEETAGGGSQSASQTESATATESADAANGNSVAQSEPATASDAAAAALSTAAARVESSGPTRGDEQNDYQLDGAGFSPQLVTVDSISGQVALLCVFGDSGTQQTPTDNKGNSYTGTLLHSSNYFADQWAPYNMRVYAKTAITGGPGHVFSVVKSSSTAAEATLVAVVANATSIQDSSIVARQSAGAGGGNMVSGPVTTTGPALLVSFWGGDGGLGVANLDTEVLAGTGWTLVYMVALEATAHIQHALAVKLVDAGTHTITWHNLGDQGAIISLIALQGGGASDAYAALVGNGAVETAAASAADLLAAVISTAAARSEAATAADVPSAQISTSATTSEPGAATDAGVAALSTAAVASEPAAAGESANGTNAGSVSTVSEAAAATDSQAATAAMLAAVAESATASDSSTALLVAVAAAAEAAAAGDLPAAVATLLAAISEAASGADAYTGTVSGANSASVTEAAVAGDSAAATAALVAVAVEAGAAAESGAATKATAATQTDAGAAADSANAARSTAGDRSETAAAADSSSATSEASPAGVIEVSVAGDASTAVAAMLATIIEVAVAQDMVLTGGLIVGDVIEPAAAADFVAWLRSAAPGDARVFSISGEQRTVTITAESRTYGIAAQGRTITITAQSRDRSI